VLFQRGEFNELSLVYTVIPLLGNATALPAFSISEILIRTFFAMQQTRLPVLIGMVQVMINLVIGSLALFFGHGVGLLALAFSIANNIEALLLFVLLGRQVPGLWQNRALWASVRSALLSTLLLAGGLWGMIKLSTRWLPFLDLHVPYHWQTDLLPLLGWLVGLGMIGVALYAGLAAAFGAVEVRTLWKRFVR
jgi:putative peptidoglycan lipid II flippase